MGGEGRDDVTGQRGGGEGEKGQVSSVLKSLYRGSFTGLASPLCTLSVHVSWLLCLAGT